MLNKIWPIFIIVSFIYALITGNIDKVNNSIFESTASAVQLSITFFRNNMLMEWNNENSTNDYFSR